MREAARAEGRSKLYDGRWRDRDPSGAPPGVKPVIRLKAPVDGETVIEDQVQGRVVWQNENLDDLVVLRSDGTRSLCSPQENRELFAATIGGLGLTGVIVWAELSLIPVASPLISVEHVRLRNLEEFFAISAASDTDHGGEARSRPRRSRRIPRERSFSMSTTRTPKK